MPFTIVRNDITKMSVDAIVNTANPLPVVGPGVDSTIHEKAGPQLLKARQRIGSISMGSAAITRGYALDAKYVIHTVGPVWTDGGQNEETLLRSCYDSALALALKKKCRSVAFPLISTGAYGFPKDKALQIAISAFSAFLLESEMEIYLVVFDSTSYRLSEKLFQGVASYIDQNYVDERRLAFRSRQRLSDTDIHTGRAPGNLLTSAPIGAAKCALEQDDACFADALSIPESKAASLEAMLQQADAGFTETLLRLIDRSGHKDSTIYKRAGLTKQHFSKIRNDSDYKPKKATAVALALALELNVKETNDLLGRAGFTLSNSSKFDLIIRYFIQKRNFNVVEINMALYEFDQPLLGG